MADTNDSVSLNHPDKGPNFKTDLSHNQNNSLDTPHTLSADSNRRSSYFSAASRRSSNVSEGSRRSSYVSEANVNSPRGTIRSDVDGESVTNDTPRKAPSNRKVGNMDKNRVKEKDLGTRNKVVDNVKLSRRRSSVAPVNAIRTRNRETQSPKLKQKQPANRRKSIRLSSDSRIVMNKPGMIPKSTRRKSTRLHSDTQIVVRKRSPSSSSCKSLSPDISDSESQPSTSRTNKSGTKRHSLKSNGESKRKNSTGLSSSRLQPILAGGSLSPTTSRKSSVSSLLSLSPVSSRRGSFCSEKEVDASASLSLSQSTRLRSRRREVGLHVLLVSYPVLGSLSCHLPRDAFPNTLSTSQSASPGWYQIPELVHPLKPSISNPKSMSFQKYKAARSTYSFLSETRFQFLLNIISVF